MIWREKMSFPEIFLQHRMKAEKKTGFPISLRSGFAISTENGKAANGMQPRPQTINSGKP